MLFTNLWQSLFLCVSSQILKLVNLHYKKLNEKLDRCVNKEQSFLLYKTCLPDFAGRGSVDGGQGCGSQNQSGEPWWPPGFRPRSIRPLADLPSRRQDFGLENKFSLLLIITHNRVYLLMKCGGLSHHCFSNVVYTPQLCCSEAKIMGSMAVELKVKIVCNLWN